MALLSNVKNVLSDLESSHEANPTIMKRVPQHEPWSHHENYDPMAVALIKTDRSEQEDIVVAEPINIPDTFKNVRT